MIRNRNRSGNKRCIPSRKRKVYSRLANPAYNIFRRMVLSRDSYCCQYPECDKKTNLEVHHIRKYSDNKGLRTEPLNGITLCQDCHRIITGKEEKYENMLQAIASRNLRETGTAGQARGTSETFQNGKHKKTSRKKRARKYPKRRYYY